MVMFVRCFAEHAGPMHHFLGFAAHEGNWGTTLRRTEAFRGVPQA